MQDHVRTILAQYANSPTINALIDSANSSIDPAEAKENFRQTVWDISSASGFGLDIWAKIVGVSRVVGVQTSPKFFGFTSKYANFGHGPFYSSGGSVGLYTLTDSALRTLILVKALTNITNTTPPNINRALEILFAGRGDVYVHDLQNMSMLYTFYFQPTEAELYMLSNSGAVPRPSGVRISYQAIRKSHFGFGPSAQGFGRATMSHGAINATI